MDDRLALSIRLADGRVVRWGPDEVDGKDIPVDLTFGTTNPGGFGSMSCSLMRRLDVDHPDQELFSTVTVTGPGGRVAYEGRLVQFPRSHGDSYAITPGAVGWSTHLRDDPTFREIYVDRDLGRLTTTSLGRRAAVAGSGTPSGKVQVGNGPGGIAMDLPNEVIPAFEIFELAYDAGPGLAISRVDYLGHRTGASWAGSWGAPTLVTASDDVFTISVSSASLTFDGVGRATASFTPNQHVLLTTQATAGHTPAAGHQQRVEMFNLIGNSGIGLYNGDDGMAGVRASDVIADVVSRAAPLLTYTTGSGGSIEATAFVIPHLVFRDPVTAEHVITDVNKFHMYDWGVWENREFFYRQPDPDRLCWEARLGDGAHMDADGLTGEQVINGVVVTYQDATGVTRTVGPPSGTAGSFDDTSADLQDTSTANPVNSHGIPAKPDNLTLAFPTTLAGAIQIGTVYLAERSLATRRGSLRLTGTVGHPTEGQVPVWRVRAGDWVRVTDLNGENASVQRKIISTSYTHSSRQITLELDNTPAKLSAILERVGVMTGIRLGGGF